MQTFALSTFTLNVCFVFLTPQTALNIVYLGSHDFCLIEFMRTSKFESKSFLLKSTVTTSELKLNANRMGKNDSRGK